MKKAISFYALIVGICMLLMWIFFLITDNVPELETKPWEIVLHLAAEFITAVLLIIAAIMTLKNRRCATPLLLVGFGMLLYTVIVSPGYYVQRGEIPFVVMFGVLAVLTIVAIVYTARNLKRDSA